MSQLKPVVHILKRKNSAPFNIPLAENLLMSVAKSLDKHNIPYHLEGGTLLGIVRDNAILPWDDDLDISIPAGHEHKIPAALGFLKKDGWRIDKRNYYSFNAIKHKGTRVFKIRDRSRGLLNMGHNYLDIFVKYQHKDLVYWQAKKKLMCVDASYYDGFDEISFQNYDFKIPKKHNDYLTEKYGDWNKTIKEWDCSKNEKTIIE